MPRNNKGGRGANGSGSIRKLTINGKTYWQGRYTTGFDPVTGKQVQRSVSGKTQAEVAKKLREITSKIDLGTYTAPCKMTLAEWVEIWTRDYIVDVRPSTAYLYQRNLSLHVLPELGSVRLDKLTTQMIQRVYNDLYNPKEPSKKPLQPKSVKDVHGVLHKLLDQAVKCNYIPLNPSNGCVLPKIEKEEVKPLEREQIIALLSAIEGHVHEWYYRIAMFTGLREGEMLGLTWDCIDFGRATLTVKQQLRKSQERGGGYYMAPTKNGKQRVIALAPSVLEYFRQQRQKLLDMESHAGCAWQKKVLLYSTTDRKPREYDLVFRNEIGDRLSYRTVYDCFKRVVKELGIPDTRIHDLRHTFAVISLLGGDDVKTVQQNLGHATASFTLDVYGHVTDQMRRNSADRMENFIQDVSA